MSRPEERLAEPRNATGYRGVLKTIGLLVVSVMILFSIAEVGGEPGVGPIVEGVNVFTSYMMEQIIDDRVLRHANFYDASPALAATLITTGDYPAPSEPYRHLLKNPIETIEMDIYDYAARLIFKEFYASSIVVIARGDLPVDSMAATAYANSQNAPVLLTRTGDVPTEVLDTIQYLSPETIMILGGEKAVSGDVESELANIAPVERIWGETRYETAVEIARKTEGFDTIIVTDGENPPIETVILGAEYRAPIIYVTSSRIPDAAREFLAENKITSTGKQTRIVLVEVSSSLESEIKNITFVEKNTAELEVIVTNDDDDDLYVDLYPGEFGLNKLVTGGGSLSFGVFVLDAGEQTIRISWLDPDTDKFYEKEEKITLSRGEETSWTINTDLHTFAER